MVTERDLAGFFKRLGAVWVMETRGGRAEDVSET